MNKFLLALVFLATLYNCKSSAPSSIISPKTDKVSQAGLSGTWQITNILYPGSQFIEVTSFQIADSKCFIGSTWNFISNNNKGTITLNGSSCEAFNARIVWSIDKAGNFGFKLVDTGVKSKSVTQGFLLRMANQSENSFQLIDRINVGGQFKDITYQFGKVN
jgi:hypothetical protein